MTARLMAGVGVLLLVLGGPAFAQSPADVHFHDAAQHYIADDLSAAQEEVERGLEVAPSDSRLLSLQEKLDQARRSEGGDSTEEQGGSSSQDSSSGEGASQDQRGENTEQPGDPGAEESEESEDPSRPPDTPSSSMRSDGGEVDRDAEGQPGGSPPGGQGALTRAQAERLLQALEGQEKQLLREVQNRASESQSAEKDW